MIEPVITYHTYTKQATRSASMQNGSKHSQSRIKQLVVHFVQLYTLCAIISTTDNNVSN